MQALSLRQFEVKSLPFPQDTAFLRLRRLLLLTLVWPAPFLIISAAGPLLGWPGNEKGCSNKCGLLIYCY